MQPIAICAFLALMAVAVALPEDTIQLDSGLIQGVVSNDARAFRGIPYVAAPIGDLRWRDPQPVAAWNGVRPAQVDGPGCIQNCTLPVGAHACPPTTSEDCLFTTVYTPRVAAMSGPLPVMVFFHGGNFHQGHGGGSIYNGTLFTNRSDVILVAVNYRLGALGFMVADPSTGINGNFGMKDQVEGLKWVQRNIAAFGGDPNQVTIFGQSAGATSVNIHLTAPSIIAQNLFHRAIAMSSPITLPLRDNTTMPALSEAFAKDVGCALTDADCFRSVSSDQILAAQLKTMNDLATDPKVILAFMPWEPYVDGTFIEQQPFIALSNGQFNHDIPVIVGNVRQEAVVFIYMAYGKPLSPIGLGVLLELILGTSGMISTLFKYPIPKGTTDTRQLASQIGTDYIFLCSNRNITRAMSNAGGTVYNYIFDHVPSFNQTAWYPESECYTAVCHGVDLPFTFDSAQPFVEYDAQETGLTQSMVDFYTSFAVSGKPTSSYAPQTWPVYTTETSQTMYFQTPESTIESFFLDDYCTYWDSIGYKY